MNKETTNPGYINKNKQMNFGRTEEQGIDHGQWFYTIECQNCNFKFKANGTDIWQRKCSNCQGGQP